MSRRLAIEEFLADTSKLPGFVQSHKFPLVEGNSVTFVWIGHADGVSLRHWVFGLESSTSLIRAPVAYSTSSRARSRSPRGS